jgi:hypothetical protein
MSLTARVITMMSGLTQFQVRALTPAERLRLASECLRLLQACDVAAPPAPRTTGVLSELRDGKRAE